MKDLSAPYENELYGQVSTRTWNALYRNRIETFAKLAELFQNSGKFEMRNIGNQGKKEILDALEKHGFPVAKNQSTRSLYMCEHARCSQQVEDDHKQLYCSMGYPLNTSSFDGKVPFTLLAEGRPLEFDVCQNCQDYKECGGPLLPGERGWIKRKHSPLTSA
jgi:hypothetical protein